MRALTPVRVRAALGFCALAGISLWALYPRPASRPLPGSAFALRPNPVAGSCEAEIREALQLRGRALRSANREREALEEWDPRAAARLDPERWRRELMAGDRTGDLRRALAAARRAEARGQTRGEAYYAALVRVRLECDAGHHSTELQEARRAAALEPNDLNALLALQHAATCAGQLHLQQWESKAGSARADSGLPVVPMALRFRSAVAPPGTR